VFGPREMTSLVKEFLIVLLGGGSLSNYKVSTVSGFVEGVDLQVLKKSLHYNVPNIICLAYGLRCFYPSYLKNLINIVENPNNLTFKYLLISNKILVLYQFSPDQVAVKWTFSRSEELLSSVGSCTIVVEGDKKSGTLYTVNQALKENKKIFSVSGSLF